MSKLEQVVEAVSKELGSEYSVQSMEVFKNNGVKVCGVVIRRNAEEIGITVYSSEECLKKDTVSEIAEFVLQKYHKAETSQSLLDNVEHTADKQFILTNVVYQLVNKEKNEELLKFIPHKEFLDLALIYRVVLKANTESVSSYVVRNDFLIEVGISTEELEEAAKENTINRLGVRCCRLEEVLKDYLSGKSPTMGLYVLTNSMGINGAFLMTYRSLLSKLAEGLNSNLIILPSSVHEVLLVVETDDLEIEDLQKMVVEINGSEVVLDEDFLSNSVYRFIKETGIVEIVE